MRGSTLSQTVHVFIALCSSVYVRPVCGSNEIYTPTIVFVCNEIVCFPITKHTISLCTKTMETSIELLKIKAMQVGLVKKALKQDD